MPNGDERPRVLVVDDERVICEILADFLAMEGFSATTAEDGKAALAELSRVRYDLVLTDLKMPNMGGIELLDAIQAHTPHIVTIIMTGFGTVETAINAMKRGAYDYILKPFKVEEVVHAIRRGLEKQKLTAENLRLKEALSLYKVSEAIAASLSLDQVIGTVVDTAIDEVNADVVYVLLRDGDGEFFERVREVNPNSTLLREFGTLETDALATHFASDSVLLVNGRKGLKFFKDTPEGMELQSLIVTTLMVRKKAVGYLAAVSVTPGKRFDEGQRKLLRIVSNRAGAAIENARLYEDLKATFRQTIRGLASAIDKMDRYTAGHSERVAGYAQILAIKLGLGEEEVEIVRQSALMHDVGKIGCVMNLNKPGKLSQQEYEVFKLHPGYGKDILEPIKFLQPLVPGVHLHHERWDGHGYPLGLKGQAIPLYARIIAVADTYDAMTSDRAYRTALPHEVAIHEITRCIGNQFDADIAHEFIEAIETKRQEQPEPRLSATHDLAE
ncbi:MAG: response regulator [Myxococcales bacterium]|nr:response regulator [Myxococcales bacterium]MCB9708309.1 response regulator [Myxococcales bacterium]